MGCTTHLVSALRLLAEDAGCPGIFLLWLVLSLVLPGECGAQQCTFKYASQCPFTTIQQESRLYLGTTLPDPSDGVYACFPGFQIEGLGESGLTPGLSLLCGDNNPFPGCSGCLLHGRVSALGRFQNCFSYCVKEPCSDTSSSQCCVQDNCVDGKPNCTPGNPCSAGDSSCYNEYTDELCFPVEVVPAPCPVADIHVLTNSLCDSQVGAECSANIVKADGGEQTKLYYFVNPPTQAALNTNSSFGSVPPGVDTDSNGTAIAEYTAGELPFGDTQTVDASLSASSVLCPEVSSTETSIFNYNGFDFHQSQVSDSDFVNFRALTQSSIQTFLRGHGSFLADFVFVGANAGFVDLNRNGRLDPGEPTYSSNGRSLKKNVRGISAASVFLEIAKQWRINPKVLLATAEKENSLISDSSLPNAQKLNFALGCGAPTNFKSQMACAGKTLTKRYHDRLAFGRKLQFPFFFRSSDGVQHFVTDIGLTQVGFNVETASTFAQYRYTPFIQSLPDGGGVFLFEQVWQEFGF